MLLDLGILQKSSLEIWVGNCGGGGVEDVVEDVVGCTLDSRQPLQVSKKITDSSLTDTK